MAKLWDAWLPDVLPHAAGCPSVLARHEIKRAAQAFFRDSFAWRAVLDAISVDIGEPEMRVFPDASGTEIVRIEQAALGQSELKPLFIDAVAESFGADWSTQTGTPEAITAVTPNTIRLVPYPIEPQADRLTLTVSLAPSDAATGIPDELYARYREAIAGGAKSRLMLISGQPWANVDMGASLSARFEADISAARTDAARAHSRATPRSRPSFC
jgi:hypothetical protein